VPLPLKLSALADSSLLPHATLLVLPSAATGARLVTTYPGMSLGTWGRARGHLSLEGLLVSKGGQLFKKRPAVGEKAFEACTQIVQTILAIPCPENAILRAPSVTEVEDVAFETIAGQGVQLELPEGPLRGAFDEIDQWGLMNIPQMVFPVHEVIAGKEIPIVLDYGNVPASLLEDAQGLLLPQSRSCRLLEDLDKYLPDVLTHPLIKDSAKKSAKCF